MFNKNKKITIDFSKGIIILKNGKHKELFLDKKGVYFKKLFKKVYLKYDLINGYF